MPRITRKQQKVFAESASNNGVFGSLQANDPAYSQDPDVIQSRTAYANGWNDATYSAEQLPPLEEFQALQYLFSRQLAYILQEGVAEWDSSTTYYKGNLVKAIQSDGSFILYASLIDNNTGNLVSDTTKWVITNTSTNFHQGIPNWRSDVIYSAGDWVKADNAGVWSIFESLEDNNLNNAITDDTYWSIRPFSSSGVLLSHAWFDYKIADVSWLRADTFSWQDGELYQAVYEHLVDDMEDLTSSTETIGTYTITYYRATDGHKIVMPDQESTVQDIFEESGVAWYYILDTTNTRFKLPRTKYGFTGLRDAVGNYVAPGLPNITGSFYALDQANEYSGAFYRGGSKSGSYGGSGTYTYQQQKMDASRSNALYGASTTVQPPATQMYLYFYVGNYTQSAVQQTAGMNVEMLNDKLDLDLGNITPETKEYITTLCSPDSSRVVSLGGAGTYTADGNGWISAKTTGTTKCTVENTTANLYNGGTHNTSNTEMGCVQVKKGDSVTVSISGGTCTTYFVPMIGG